MTSVVAERRPEQDTRLAIVDCDIHPAMRSLDEVTPYLPERWRVHHQTYGALMKQAYKGGLAHFRVVPDTARADSFPPGGGPPGSDLAFMQEQHLDANNVAYGMLIPLRVGPGNQRNLGYGAALASAVNDWQIDYWLARDSRLRGSITIAQEDPDASVAEIEKRAGDRRFVQVQVPPRTLEPLGRPRYRKIFECAAANDIPIALHVGGINGHAVSGAGWPSFYFEEHHTNVTGMQSLLISMVFEGLFEHLPKLRVLLIEGGFVWSPALAWRMDNHWQRMKDEVPHLKRPPSDYVREHFWYTTQPIDEPPRPRQLIEVMEWVSWDKILFSTDYPHWDYDDPRHTFKGELPEGRMNQIMRDNAKAFFALD